MKKINKQGFTLIELLAVITIIGILMMLAIPSVSWLIEKSRKETFAVTAQTYANAAKKLWTADGLLCGSDSKYASSVINGDYYILIDTSDETITPLLESGGKSPWGNRDVKGYVRITKDVDAAKATKYYVALTDGIHAIYDDKGNPIESYQIDENDVIQDISNDTIKLNAIQIKPFENGRYTTCSEESFTWDGRPIFIESGTGTEVGNEICLKDECFYVISSDENSVTMLAKYNLHVGGVYLQTGYQQYGSSATGIQNPEMNGYDGDYPYNGTIPFSNTNYWNSYVSTYPTYVYNSNSNIFQHVENYKTYLSNLGITINDARLIRRDELETLGCTFNPNYGVCGSGAPKWVYSSTYWSGNADSYQNVLHVTYRNYFISSSARYRSNSVAGVRPVITIPRSEL